MHTPMTFRTMKDLIGTIEVSRQAFADSATGGSYLCTGDVFEVAPKKPQLRTEDTVIATAQIDFIKKKWAAKSVTLFDIPIFLWADQWARQDLFSGDVEAYAQNLIDTNQARIG